MSCSGTRHLPSGEKLYTGAEIKLESTTDINKKQIKTVVEGAFRPEPNKVFLGLRPRVWMYNTAGENPKTKLDKWLRKHGTAPVLLSEVKPAVTSTIIDATLFNNGFFKSYTEYQIADKKHTAEVVYTSHIREPYKIKELSYAVSDDSLNNLIIREKKKSLIKTGEEYNLDRLKNERERIDGELKNNGYFYFNPDYLLFKADTSEANHSVNLKLTLKDSVPQNALTVYRIHKVVIDQDYSLSEDAAEVKKDTMMFQNTVFMVNHEVPGINPKEILRSVYLKKNEIFSRKNHAITLNRLMSLDNFKFVRVKFTDSDTTAAGYLDVTILMTPMPKRTFRAEMDLVTKSNNFTGPRMNLSLQNRNTFHGAEILKLNMAGSFEAQLNGTGKNRYSYSWNPQLDLTFPRFITPFNIHQTQSIYIPKTNFSLSYNYLKRVDYFDMKTFQFGYSYKWKENILKEHELTPISVSFSTIGNKSVAFDSLLNSNPYLKKSYEEQFIAGGSYSFTYNEQVLQGKKMQYFFHATTEFAGNAFSLAKNIAGEKISSANPSKVIGSVYSQFAKLSLEGRGYYNFKDKNSLAMRIFAGVAKPYGNSSVLPYSKQFFSGGPNSLRAFQVNSVGPGTYNQKTDTLGILQIGGDIKLEANVEYRFGIYRYFKGALFVDAGNVWLQKSNPSNLGSPFLFSKFMDQLAVGTGFGLRVDVSFFVLRFDLAMPLRKIPEPGDNFRWVTNEINFGSSAWRKDNLVLNVAIGYPF
ncbi:MAG: BamA/TamA family outer membrane protein [Prolixibacteraceae bacterium]